MNTPLTLLSMLTTCIPLERFWNPMAPGKCIKLREFCIASGLLHVFLDVFILAFPLPIIWRLKTTTSTKLTVSLICLLGVFATIGGLLRLDCLIPILDYDEADFTETAWIGVLFQILENTCGVICSCAPMLSTYVGKAANTTFATSVRRFITTNLSRISQGSGASGNSRRSARSAHSSTKVHNPTIGSWKINHIKKESTFGVTPHGTVGESQEYLAESSQRHTEPGASVEIEMDNFSKSGSNTTGF
ncbi:hypothetical protein BDV95DRAFT_600652 [Massariosphaeria phaeospora]|uniref:Rhodopsin domain-containing protein n=1 Tax=Massariosphaeria phaeospora TaxID=100035 RepID=A0A7C8MKS7_9PLEO|nr:hypothetical protein BDV95DRAFT_600652 [Massariosphaeria phaeospora]